MGFLQKLINAKHLEYLLCLKILGNQFYFLILKKEKKKKRETEKTKTERRAYRISSVLQKLLVGHPEHWLNILAESSFWKSSIWSARQPQWSTDCLPVTTLDSDSDSPTIYKKSNKLVVMYMLSSFSSIDMALKSNDFEIKTWSTHGEAKLSWTAVAPLYTLLYKVWVSHICLFSSSLSCRKL